MNTSQFLLTLTESEYLACITHQPSNPALIHLWEIVIDWASIHYPNLTITQ